ncbi:MAG TPA: fasciclin domain-containing protein [bacterium]|nr:fasciclin domain-containing protein [bacterium]
MKRMMIAAVLCLGPWANATAATVAEVVAAKDPAFSTALESAGLASMLKGGLFTVFVPSSDAFAKVDGKLRSDPDRLRAVLAYHIVPAKVTPEQLRQMLAAKTVNGKELKISNKGETVQVGRAKVLPGETTASNGVVYGIDAVLMP